MNPWRFKEKPLTVRDEIHGDITFDQFIRQVIDHECFQRLRYIKQLGLAEYVFPCATHTRFQHSLGAAYLAGQCYEAMLESWLTAPFPYDGKLGTTQFFATRTLRSVQAVAAHPPSREFWWRAVTLAGMLHDVGHGPWSHSFEVLNLDQDFSEVTEKMSGAIGDYYSGLAKAGQKLHHEDISVLYIFKILTDLVERGVLVDLTAHFLSAAMMVNRKMASGDLQVKLEAELEEALKGFGVKRGQ